MPPPQDRQPDALELARAAFRRWGMQGAAVRTWQAFRKGGVALVVAKLRSYISTVRRNPHMVVAKPPARAASNSPKAGFPLDADRTLAPADWSECLRQMLQRADGKGHGNVGKPTALWVALSADAGLTAVPTTWNALSSTLIAADPYTLGTLAAELASDCYVLFARLGDRIEPQVAPFAAEALADKPALLLFDLVSIVGDHVRPLLLPGMDDIHGLACDYFRTRFLIRGDALRAASAAGAVTPLDAARWIMRERLAGAVWPARALPLPLLQIADDGPAIEAERKNLITEPAHIPHSGATDISVIICTKDKGHLVRQLIRSLRADLGRDLREVIIVSNQTTNPFAKQTLREIEGQDVKLVSYDERFNFSRQCNIGAAQACGEFLLFLNDDIVPVSEDWLARLRSAISQDDIAAAGPLLLYPNETVQHAGMFLGFSGVAGHTLRGARLPDQDYLFMASAPRQVSALTGAALLVRSSVFNDLNGFDPLLASFIQDVDLCMRITHSGKRLVFEPRSILLHLESVSVGETLHTLSATDQRAAEHLHFTRRWGETPTDTFHNPNFSPSDETLRSLRGVPPRR